MMRSKVNKFEHVWGVPIWWLAWGGGVGCIVTGGAVW